MIRKILLACGVLSSLLYVAMTVFVAMQWEGYGSVSQTISELSAIGAPTRSLWVPPAALYTVLVTAFGWGVWKSVWERINISVFLLWVVVLAIRLWRVQDTAAGAGRQDTLAA